MGSDWVLKRVSIKELVWERVGSIGSMYGSCLTMSCGDKDAADGNELLDPR